MTKLTRIIEDLRPSKSYIFRVRAINAFGQVSEWSEALVHETPGDFSTPNAPSEVTTNFDSPDLIVRWRAPGQNTDGSIISDLDHYIITFSTPDGRSISYESGDTLFVFTFEMNQQVFGSPQPNLDISIVAIDTSDRRSEAVFANAVNARPEDPTEAPFLVSAFTLINVSMSKGTLSDFRRVSLYHSTNNVTFNSITVPEGTLNYTHSVAQASTHYYKYKLVDVFNQESTGFSPVASDTTLSVSDAISDVDPPTTPTGFQVLNQGFELDTNAYTEFGWVASTDADSAVSYYEIQYKRVSDFAYSKTLISGTETETRIDGLKPGVDYSARIRAVDTYGNASPYTALLSFTTATDTIPPAIPTGFTTTPGIGSIGVNWSPNIEVDLSHYELYGKANEPGFITGASNLIHSGNSTGFVMTGVDFNDVWYFRLRAVDDFDNASDPTVEFSESSIVTYVEDLDAPATPVNVSISSNVSTNEQITRARIEVEWAGNTEPDLAGYELGIREDGEIPWTTISIPAGVTSNTLSNLYPSTTYNIRLAAFDRNLNKSNYYHADETTPGDDLAPATPTDPALLVVLKTIFFSWSKVVATDLEGYQVVVTRDDGTPTIVDEWEGNLTYYEFLGEEDTEYSFKVRAFDRSGNYSDFSIPQIATTGFQADSIFAVDENGVYVGSSSFNTAPFRVGYDGKTVLTKATITGAGLIENELIIDTAGFKVDKEGDTTANSITVNDGVITGGTIDIGGSDATSFHVDSSGQMWMGASIFAAAPFRVSNTGALDIGGVDGTSFHIDNAGNMWSGDGAYATAPFKVSNGGALTADNVTITGSDGNIINTTNFVVSGTGAVTADSGVFNSGTINGSFSVTGDLSVNGGSINLTSGDLNVSGTGDINVSNGEVIVSADGAMRSSNYDSGTETGWYLGATGLDLNGLSLDAGSINIGVSNANLFKNSSLENGTTTATNWVAFVSGGAAANFTVADSDFLFQSKSQEIELTGSGDSAGIYQDVAFNEPIEAGDTVTVSYWVKQTVGTANVGRIWFYPFGSGFSALRSSYTQSLTVGSWVRMVDQYTATSTIADGLRIYLLLGTGLVSGDIFYLDGAQIQKSDYVTDFQPAALDIPDNYINTAHISDLSADKLTSGIINAHTIEVGGTGHIQSFDWVEGNAGYRLSADGVVFQNGSVTIVGAGGAVVMDSTQLRATYGGLNTFVANSTGLKLAGSIDVTTSAIQSSNFNTTNGWQITASGVATFNSITARNSIFLGENRLSVGGGSTSDYLASSNFVSGSTGWRIRGNGDVEFNGGTFRGALDVGGSDSTSFHVDTSGNMWLGASSYGSAPFRVSSTGSLYATSGTFYGNLSGNNISGATITGSTVTGGSVTLNSSGLQFTYNGSNAGSMYGSSQSGSNVIYASGSLSVSSIIYTSTLRTTNFTQYSSGTAYFGGPTEINSSLQVNGVLYAYGRISAVDGSSSYPAYNFNNDTNTGMYRNSSSLRLVYNGVSKISITSTMISLGGGVEMTGLPITSSASANVLITPSGVLYESISSSSARYKKNIKLINTSNTEGLTDLEKRLLNMDLVSFIYKKDPENIPHIGLIAEEVEELLGEDYAQWFVSYDNKGRPDSLRYDKLSIMMIPIFKKMAQKIGWIE